MSPIPRQKIRTADVDSDRKLRTRLDILIALMMVQIILSIGLWVDRPRDEVNTSMVADKPMAEPEEIESDPVADITAEFVDEIDHPELISQEEIDKIDWSKLKIDVLNGCGVAGVAAKAEKWLTKRGYKVRITENADRHDYQYSFLQDRSGHLDAAIKLAEVLEISPDQIQELKGTPSPYTDFTLVLGKDCERLDFVK